MSKRISRKEKLRRKKISASLRRYNSIKSKFFPEELTESEEFYTPDRELSYKEQDRRRRISEGLKRYHSDLKNSSRLLNIPQEKLKKEIQSARNLNKEGIHDFLKKKKLPAGRKNLYYITIIAKDTKGISHRVTINKKMGGASGKKLKNGIEWTIQEWLRANGLAMARYKERFKQTDKHFLRDMRVIIKKG